MRTLRLGMGQINSTVGDLEGNTRKIIQHIQNAKKMDVDLLTFPELGIPGYPSRIDIETTKRPLMNVERGLKIR
jgi:predicted amidohydrolase